MFALRAAFAFLAVALFDGASLVSGLAARGLATRRRSAPARRRAAAATSGDGCGSCFFGCFSGVSGAVMGVFSDIMMSNGEPPARSLAGGSSYTASYYSGHVGALAPAGQSKDEAARAAHQQALWKHLRDQGWEPVECGADGHCLYNVFHRITGWSVEDLRRLVVEYAGQVLSSDDLKERYGANEVDTLADIKATVAAAKEGLRYIGPAGCVRMCPMDAWGSQMTVEVLARYFNIEVEVYTTDMTGMEPMIMNEGGEFKARILYTGGHWKGLRDAHGDFWQVNTRKEDDAKACWQVRRMVFEALAPAENAAGEPAPACAGHDETVSSGKLEERPVQDCSLLAGVEPAKGVAVVEELSTSEGGSGDERGMSTTGGSGDELGSGSSTGAPVGIGSLVHDQPESKQPESKQPESKQPVGIGSSECAQPPGSKESCPTRTMNTVFAPHEGAAASSTFLAGSRAGSTPTPTIPAITPDYYYSCE